MNQPLRALARDPDPAIAVILGCIALAFYVASLPPSYAFWDTGELQTVASILGIAHPPACPAFVLLGWLFAHTLPFHDSAWRVDFMCAMAIAASVSLAYMTARSFGSDRAPAVVVTFGFALASVTWRDATRAEVQDLALFFRVLAFACALVYARSGSPRAFFAMALATGLAGATHGISLLLLPGLAIVVLSRGLPSPRAWGLGVAGVALGLLPYAYLPLRSAWISSHHLDPTVALGLPAGLPFWNYDDPETLRNFVRVITGADFDVHSGFAGFAHVGDYGAFGERLGARVLGAYGYVGIVAAALGAGVLVLRKGAPGIALVIVALLPVPYTESYNELQDPDRYYLFTLWCAAIAICLAYQLLVEVFRAGPRSIVRYGFLGGLIASCAGASPDRQSMFVQASDTGAPDYVAEIKALTPDDAIVLAEWAYSTPLAYASYVDHSFGDRVVVSAGTDQYTSYIAGWLAKRPVYFVSFSDDLTIPGLHTSLLKDGPYYAYAITR